MGSRVEFLMWMGKVNSKDVWCNTVGSGLLYLGVRVVEDRG